MSATGAPRGPGADGAAAPLRVEAASAAHAAALAELFAAEESPCHCRWWHFEGDKNAWLARCAFEPAENRAELAAALATGDPSAAGVVALAGALAVGWLKLAPAPALAKLYRERPYRGLPGLGAERPGVAAVGCVLVRSTHRGQGVAHALVQGALAQAVAAGYSAVEAFPRGRPDEPPERAFTGPLALFTAAGFRVVDASTASPVLRWEPPPG